MSPLRRRRAAPAVVATEPVERPRERPVVVAYVWVLVVAALGALVALVVTGAAWPPPLGLLVFALLLALTISRAVLYPSEFAITAESALLLAAVVVFRGSAPFTGPLVLALLVGALDRVHWEQRAFLRMAYNGGGRGVTILAAASTFHLLDDALGGSTAATVLAIVAGALTAAVLDGLIAVGLAACRGARPGASVRAIAEIDALDLPLAVAGGLCGLLVVEVGWWAALVPLVALALVPEIVHARRAASLLALRDSLLAVELLVVGALVARWSGVPDVPTVCVLAAVAVIAGAELVVDHRVPVPPVLGVVVVGTALAVGPDDAQFAAALVAGLATAVSWWVRGRRPTVGATLAVCGASLLGVAAASVGTAEVHSDVAVLGLGIAAVAGIRTDRGDGGAQSPASHRSRRPSCG